VLRSKLAVCLALALGFSSAACGSGDSAPSDGAPSVTPANAWEQAGPHPVGHAVFPLTDATTQRTLLVEVWYPADAAAREAADRGVPTEDMIPPGADHDTMAGLVASAPEGCTRKTTRSAADATPAAGPWPLVVFSHCKGCLRLSSFSVAERLASLGFAVAAPDHQGDTLFDTLRGTSAPLDGAFLATRAGDVRFVLDTLLDAQASAVPAAIRGSFDASRVGMMGHSYGGATTGLVAQDDPRVLAGLSFAAPMENPLTPGAKMASIDKPVAFWLAVEDNSITKIGNDLIESNFGAAKKDAWLWKVADAGHWSVSDICGIVKGFSPGCGPGNRQSGGEDFTYLANDAARGLAASYAAAFFSAELLGDAAARAWLATGPAGSPVTASKR
jgi:predicted dienelactone hydrolase